MTNTQIARMRYGETGMDLRVPKGAAILAGQDPPALPEAARAVREAMDDPIGSPPLKELLAARNPASVAITISDITRPVPNRDFLPVLLETLNASGVADSQIVILIGTGMHRPSTPAERADLVGEDILSRVAVVDHRADAPETLVGIGDDPPVRICRRFVEADFRIVTGFIEPHFMAGFSGGRKGVCPALVDLDTVQRFHGYDTLADPRARAGVLDGNPCHEIALAVARKTRVDFLLNVAVTRQGRIAGVYAGDLEQAHLAGCEQVRRWVTAETRGTYDLVITSGGGAPLDQTFYQTVKGICAPLEILAEDSTLLTISHCGQGVGSQAYTDILRRWHGDWRGFLRHLADHPGRTERDQWELQVQCRVLERIGPERLMLATDGIDPALQRQLALTPLLGAGNAAARAQRFVDDFLAARDRSRVAVLPDGPYTMLRPTRA
jgi:nickel-dependent lactate racemase